MYDIKWIRENAEIFDRGRARRGLEPISTQLLAFDDARRAAIGELQRAQERRNAASKEIGAAMKAGDGAKAEALKAEVATDQGKLAGARRSRALCDRRTRQCARRHSQHAAR